MARVLVKTNSDRRKNYAQNSEFRFFQRLAAPGTLTSFVDETYGPDRWMVQCSLGSDSVQVARLEESPTDERTRYACQVRQPNATARQISLIQPLESNRVIELRGKTVTFAIKARTDSTEIPNIRMAIIEWTGTADTLSFGITNGNWSAQPTLNANMVYAGVSGDLPLTASYQQFSVTATLSNSFTNLFLFVWTPVAEAQNEDFYLSQVQLVQGSGPAKWADIAISEDQDLIECQRFLEQGRMFQQVGASLSNQTTWVNYATVKRASATMSQYLAGTFNSATFNSFQSTSTNGVAITVDYSVSSANALVHWRAAIEL